MNSSTSTNAEVLLSQALAGSQECFGKLLHIYSNYLKLLVTGHLERRLQVRVSASDVVQETFLEANRDFPGFRGSSSQEFKAWLQQILVNNLRRVVEQHVLTQKRDVRREVTLEALANSVEQSTVRLEALIPDQRTTASSRVHRQEMEIVLADEIAKLPEDYRKVIILRHIEALSFEAIAQRLNRSAGAVRMLWLRAIRTLREQVDPESNHD